MAGETNNHQMRVDIGVRAEYAGLEQLQRQAQTTNESIEHLTQTAQQLSANFREVGTNVNRLAGVLGNVGDSSRNFGTEATNIMNKFRSGTQSATDTVAELRREYERLNTLLAQNRNDTTAQNAIRASMAQTVSYINQTERQITQIKKAGLDERVALNDTSLNKELQDHKDHVAQLKSLWQQSSKDYANIQKQMNAKSTLKDFTAGAGTGLKQSLIGAGISLAGVRAITAEVQNLGREIIDIDYKLVNTQRIMKDFSNETADFLLDNASEMAKQTNIQITDAQEIQSAWVRINDAYAQNKELLSEISMLTSKFMNVGEIEDAESAVTLLNASLLQFGITASDAIEKSEEFLNKWAYMADVTAMGTADEYGEAISKFGAQIDALGGTMDDAIALSSVMADSLAKDGAEAGNALKTFTTYLNRGKTISLFSQIAEDLGDTSYQLVDANGRFKDFESTLKTVAQAYQAYAQAGNDAMAQDILNAVGATRQRDTALAILNAVNDGSYKEYLSQINSVSADGYLDEQNAALMETFTAQWNELKVSIEEFGMAFARSGILSGIGLLMDGMGGLLSIIAQTPKPILTVVNAFLGLKAAKTAAEYIGNLTGITQKYQQLINQGTTAEVEQANAINQSVNAYKTRQEAYIQEMLQRAQVTRLTDEERTSLSTLIATYGEQKMVFAELEAAYNSGTISAAEYNQAIQNVVSAEQLNANAQRMTREELLISAGVMDADTHAININTEAEQRNTTTKQKGLAATISNIVQTAKSTFAIQKENNAKVAAALYNKIMDSSLLSLIKSETATNAISSLLGTTFSFLGTAAAGASAGIAALMSALNPILMVVSIATTLYSLADMLFNFGDSAEAASEQLNELQAQIDETKSRMEELQALERDNGLTNAEKAELEYLEQKNAELEKSIKLKQQEKNNAEWEDNGGFLGWGTSEGSKESLQDLIDEYDNAALRVNNYSKTLEGLDKESAEAEILTEQLTDANKELRTSAADLVSEYYRLKENYDSGFYSGDAAVEVGEYLEQLETMLPTLSALTEEHQNLSDTISTLADETEAYVEDIEGVKNTIEDLNDLFDEYNKEGYLSYETVSKLVAEHPEYVKYLVKVGDQYKLNKLAEEELNAANKNLIETTDELIAKLGEQSEIGQEISQDMIDAVDAVDYYTIGIRDTFGNIEGINEFVDNLREINVTLLKGESTIEEYNTSMNDLINSLDFSKVNDDLSKMDETTKQVAQSQQAMLTSLAQEVSNYMMEITNALFAGQMSATEYVNALQGSNENILDMYVASNDLVQNQAGKWVDAAGAVDTYANSLQNAINGLNGMTEATQFLEEHQSILADLQANTANGMVDATWWAANQQSEAYQTMATDFSGLMQNMHDNNYNAWDNIVKVVASANHVSREDIVNSNGTITETAQANAKIMGAFTTATMNSVSSSVTTAASAAGNVLNSLGEMIKNFKYTIKFEPQADLNFDASKILEGKSPFSGSGLRLKITGEGGSSVTNFANSLSTFGNSLKNIDFGSYFNNIGSYTPRSYQSVGGNGLAGSNYSPSNYNGSSRNTPATRTPTGKSGSGSSSSKKSDAEKAAEEALKAIEKITNEYVKNVESMYDRIAKALKKKYQEQYDERKKLLEKEHNERVAQIQAEIDKLNGNTPEDKQAQLNRLKEQYEKWSQDDSTLGKAKQKEYLDQIKELEKEIQIDELEKQLEEENERYEQSIDSDSEFYDAILRKLDQQMTDESLYREAADLIRNGKTQEIIDLLSEYDAKWDGWATLMGKTAGQVIAEEVALALANYKDVKNGTITENGGTNTNKLTGGGTSGSSSGGTSTGGSNGKTVAKGSKVKISNTSAGMYVASDSKSKVGTWKGYSGNYFVVNDKNGRAALAKTNNINGAIGWIDKKYLVGLATGGYTGDSEGLAMLHKKERVLNAQQTSAFEHLVYDFLPRVSKELLNPLGNTYNSNGNITFNKELVKVDIGTVVNNKQFDMDNGIDNLDRVFRKSLKKSGINLKK